MNCKNIQEKIDQLVFEQNIETLKMVEQHIQDCTKCSIYFNDSSSDRELFRKIQNAEPVMENPVDLTNSILNSIENLDQESLAKPVQKTKQRTLLPLFVRLLAAASVCLLLVLGAEQFMVVKQVKNLEASVNLLSGSPSYTAQASAFLLLDASDVNSRLIHLMLKRNNNLQFQSALNYQSEYLSEKTNTQQQNTFLNSKIYKLIGN